MIFSIHSLLLAQARLIAVYCCLQLYHVCLQTFALVLLRILHYLYIWFHLRNSCNRSNVVTVVIQNVFRGSRSSRVHRSILDSNFSSCVGDTSICSLLFDVNGQGTWCSWFSRLFIFVFSCFFQIVPQSRCAEKKKRRKKKRN